MHCPIQTNLNSEHGKSGLNSSLSQWLLTEHVTCHSIFSALDETIWEAGGRTSLGKQWVSTPSESISCVNRQLNAFIQPSVSKGYSIQAEVRHRKRHSDSWAQLVTSEQESLDWSKWWPDIVQLDLGLIGQGPDMLRSSCRDSEWFIWVWFDSIPYNAHKGKDCIPSIWNGKVLQSMGGNWFSYWVDFSEISLEAILHQRGNPCQMG